MIALVPTVNETTLDQKRYVIHVLQRVRLVRVADRTGVLFIPVARFEVQSFCSFTAQVEEVGFSDATVVDCPECLRQLK